MASICSVTVLTALTLLLDDSFDSMPVLSYFLFALSSKFRFQSERIYKTRVFDVVKADLRHKIVHPEHG